MTNMDNIPSNIVPNQKESFENLRTGFDILTI